MCFASPKTPQLGSTVAFLGRVTALVCMEGHPGGSTSMWKSEGTVEYHERGIKFYHSCLFPLPERSRQTAVQRARDSEPRTLVIKGEIMPWDEQHQALVTQPPSEFSAFLSCTKMSFLWRKQRERQGHERCNNVGG